MKTRLEKLNELFEELHNLEPKRQHYFVLLEELAAEQEYAESIFGVMVDLLKQEPVNEKELDKYKKFSVESLDRIDEIKYSIKEFAPYEERYKEIENQIKKISQPTVGDKIKKKFDEFKTKIDERVAEMKAKSEQKHADKKQETQMKRSPDDFPGFF